jgi:stage II sporulation protein D
MRRVTTVFFLFFFLFFLNIQVISADTGDLTVRVLVAENQKTLKIRIKGAYRLTLIPSLQVVKKGTNLDVTVLPTAQGLSIDGMQWVTRGVRIDPAEERDLFVNKLQFRGSMDILKSQTGVGLDAINRLEIESYLYGVLHREVAAWWPLEALKAQAIAARTYAVYEIQVSKKAEYDVKNTTSSQVYGGSGSERYRTNKAVDETSGQILTFDKKVFPAYFHATCGGITAGSKELWNIDVPPLAGRKYCGFCRFSPHFTWSAKVPLAEIEDKLNKNGRPIGQVIDLKPITQTPSKRVGSLKITGTSGEAVLAAKDFRVWIGGERMRSTAYSIEIQDDTAIFKGHGWGHGVGLCQWGALGQALLGRNHHEILNFYYPKAVVENYRKLGLSAA